MKNLSLLTLLIPTIIYCQFGNYKLKPISWGLPIQKKNILTKTILVDSTTIEKTLLNHNNNSTIAAIGVDISISFNDFNLFKILDNGDKIYQLKIYSPKAKGMSFFFDHFNLAKGASLWVYDETKNSYKGAYTTNDNFKNNKFSTSPIYGETIVIEYLEPKNMLTPIFTIEKMYYFFDGLKDTKGSKNGFARSQACEVNAACSENSNYTTEKSSTCQLLIYGGGNAYYCSGTLVNNTNQDGIPYILTANHCSNNSTINDLPNWEFQFYYESSSCTSPKAEPNGYTFKGCKAIAYTGNDGGDQTSDFFLLRLTSAIPSSLNINYMGWDRTNTASPNGICYHHPAGDIKKISTYNQPLVSTSYGGVTANTHWQVKWSSTINGFGVTEGGSSGSGILNANKLLVGTLTGGSSDCNTVNGLDMYGKFYFHWDKNGSTSVWRLKDWLDPINSGVTTLASSQISVSKSIEETTPEINYNVLKDKITIFWETEKYFVNLYDLSGNKLRQFEQRGNYSEINTFGLGKQIVLIEISNNKYHSLKKIALPQ